MNNQFTNNENKNQKIMVKIFLLCFVIFMIFYFYNSKSQEIIPIQQSAGGSYLKLQETIDSFRQLLI
jgi:hypothetical protein